MLSGVIRKRIEDKFGQTIRYSKDCDSLSDAIYAKCKARVSPSTLKRLFGFIKGSQDYQPRVFTLDAISSYLDFHSWDDLLSDILDDKPKKEQRIELIECTGLKRGAKFHVRFGPVSFIDIEHVGKSRFRLIGHERSGLVQGDILEITKVELNVPLLIQHIKRNELTLTGTILGKVSGVTEIRKI
jgi:hypothetical protein